MDLQKRYDEMLRIDFDVFKNDWNKLENFLRKINNPQFIILNDLILYDDVFVKFPNLIKVDGKVKVLSHTVTSLNNLEYVNGDLDLNRCVNLTSLGNLKSVGGHLYLFETPLSKKYSEEEIRQMVNIKGKIIF